MGPDVVSDLVLAGDDGADQIRVADGGPAHREERRPYPSSGQVVEDPRGELRVRSVVEADRRVRVDGFGGPDHLPNAEAPRLAVGASGACVLPGPVVARRGRGRSVRTEPPSDPLLDTLPGPVPRPVADGDHRSRGPSSQLPAESGSSSK